MTTRSTLLKEGYRKGLMEAHRIISGMLNEGWDGIMIGDRATKQDIMEEVRRFYEWDEAKSSCEVLKDTMVGSTYYCLMKKTDNISGKSIVMIGVAFTEKEGRELFVKTMTENEGPNDGYKCPAAYLKQADEPQSEWAAEWREKCGGVKQQSKQYNSLVTGDCIHLKNCTLGGKDKVYFNSWHPFKNKPYMMVSLETNDKHVYSVRLPKDKIEKIDKA